jgi:mono/diheme cytochrome c family protein
VNGEAAAAEWRKWANRIAAIAPYMITDTVGVNPANNLTLALLAHRHAKTLAWSDAPLMEPPPNKPLPVSVPPLWNVDKKHALFYNSEGRGDHARFMMLASTVCTDTTEEAARIDAWITDVRAYLASLKPPEYPYAIDRALAAAGEDVFNANCKRCHGSYGDRPRYPNKVIALEKIETDPALAEGGYYQADRFIRWFNQSFYGQISRAAPALGYIAPPLDGVWATAPYLHNGSVPTIAALLDSKERPAFWRYASARPEYDPVAVGWRYEPLAQGKAKAGRDERKWIYDTALEGYGNEGHTVGDKLNEVERRAVIEYLKTL